MKKVYSLLAVTLPAITCMAQTSAILKDIYNYTNTGTITGPANYTDVGSNLTEG